MESKSYIALKKTYTSICVFCLKEISYKHGHKPKKCPYCESENWKKPPTETELFLLQKKYIYYRDDVGDKKKADMYFTKMYLLLLDYAKSMILKTLKGKYKFDSDELDEKSHDSVMRFMDYYLSKKNFRIINSFGGYLRSKILEELYINKNEDFHCSLNLLLSDNSTDDDRVDCLSRLNITSLYQDDINYSFINYFEKKNFYLFIVNIIDIIACRIKESRGIELSILFLLSFYNRCKYNPVFVNNRVYDLYGTECGKFVEEVFVLLYRYIKGV